jgi:hypothetical protein
MGAQPLSNTLSGTRDRADDPAMFEMDGGAMQGGFATIIFIKAFFILFMILVPIVLLNMLIAVMSDSYERVENQVGCQSPSNPF